jgi:NAD-dependent deacetylase
VGAEISLAIDALRAAKSVSVLTGAGISKESGIPTFREAQTGLWSKYDPHKLATPEGFLNDPPLVWTWYDYRRKLVTEAQPNAGHVALSELQHIKPTTVVTQNVDGLHARAGSKDIIELHGSILKFFCLDKRHPADNVPPGLDAPPTCTICGAMLRPAVVWFGEALPPQALQKASDRMQSSDLVLVVGTSGLVHPAAGLPYLAKRSGAKVIEINPDRTPITDIADIFLDGPSGAVLPALLAGLRGISSDT